MNKERILELAKDLRASAFPTFAGDPIQFDMRHYFMQDECGTRCCIAGMAVFKYAHPETFRDIVIRNRYESEGARLLGLDMDQTSLLFAPYKGGGHWGNSLLPEINTDRYWAARCLEKFAETGIIDWEGTEYT